MSDDDSIELVANDFVDRVAKFSEKNDVSEMSVANSNLLITPYETSILSKIPRPAFEDVLNGVESRINPDHLIIAFVGVSSSSSSPSYRFLTIERRKDLFDIFLEATLESSKVVLKSRPDVIDDPRRFELVTAMALWNLILGELMFENRVGHQMVSGLSSLYSKQTALVLFYHKSETAVSFSQLVDISDRHVLH